MAVDIKNEVVELFNTQGTVKVLVTLDESGQPHAVVKNSLRFSGDGKLFYLELLESSKSYRNFTRSLWFNQKVTVSAAGENGASYQVKGVPEKILISGPVFEKHYRDIREKPGDVDLAAVCVINPEEVINETFKLRFEEQENRQPVFRHLDRLAK